MKKDIFRIGVRVPDRELQTIEDENVSPERKSFLSKMKDLFD